jgi:hypothetical protein
LEGPDDVRLQRIMRAFYFGESDQECVVAMRAAGRRVVYQEAGRPSTMRNKWYAVLLDMNGQAFHTDSYHTYKARVWDTGRDTFGQGTVSRAFPSLNECLAYFRGAGLESVPPRVIPCPAPV